MKQYININMDNVQMSNWTYVICSYGLVQFQQYPFACFMDMDIRPIGLGPNVQLNQLDHVQFQHWYIILPNIKLFRVAFNILYLILLLIMSG